MKKQWLSMILVLCMVLCLAPTTAHAAESKKGTLKVITKVIGLPDGVSAAGKTFTFKVGMKLPGGISYQPTPLVITIGADGRTGEGSMEVTSEYQYLVVETAHDDIADYRWDYVTYPGGGYNESKLVWVYENAVSEPIYVNNGFEELANSEINSLPLTVAGYALDADVSAVTVAKMETGVTIQSFKIKQYNAAAGSWDDLTSGTFQADTKYAIEIFLGRVAGCDSTGLTRDKVTVNGNEVSVFENPSTGDMRVFHELEVLKVVKKVDHIEITTPPTKTVYNAGDKFDPKGMVVTAVYEDDSMAVLPETGYTIFHGENLQRERTYVTIQYNDGSGSSDVKVNLPITVNPYKGDHRHTYDGGPWYADAKSHWHQCTDKDCPDLYASTKDLASHTFVWKIDKAATATETGSKHEECTVCGFERNETEIPTRHGGRPDTKPDGGAENTATSPKTGDAGIALYAGLSLLALSGSGWVVGKKRRGEK
jgi:LPXTG-motif cell wall-anchored protein